MAKQTQVCRNSNLKPSVSGANATVCVTVDGPTGHFQGRLKEKMAAHHRQGARDKSFERPGGAKQTKLPRRVRRTTYLSSSLPANSPVISGSWVAEWGANGWAIIKRKQSVTPPGELHCRKLNPVGSE